jgi:hypothetical protein
MIDLSDGFDAVLAEVMMFLRVEKKYQEALETVRPASAYQPCRVSKIISSPCAS